MGLRPWHDNCSVPNMDSSMLYTYLLRRAAKMRLRRLPSTSAEPGAQDHRTAQRQLDGMLTLGIVGIPLGSLPWAPVATAPNTVLFVRGNVDESELQAAVEPLAPPGFEVQTGAEFLEDKRSEVGGFGRTLKVGLQGFAVLALFVGGFVIYNTFSVIVAQRLRELAVLAAVGATPKQLK